SKQTEVTKKDKAQVVYELRHQFPVQSLLVLANIPRSTYYYWLKNAKRPDPDADLKVLIRNYSASSRRLFSFTSLICTFCVNTRYIRQGGGIYVEKTRNS
ncbi:hypothetical protein COJ06_23195, partial [Bacillus cereus]